ncbi:hypothetical protein TanjilG_32461 [Lupinus angustifolius]|uniref:Uncharacterized protein n=1 Tax=Lupinus angustifolius TaxID=3871 RepID=A0A1J7IBW6_LUPAN|nr:PREDICTED: uncharacterized protein LOC109347380 [Lupinus angustifolius]OIW12345.1 hypothetical protein TanjilG_32461 [Lupinus angustifolius]
MAFLDYENKRGDSNKLQVHFDLPVDDDYHISHHHKDSSSSISSDSSQHSDSDDSEKDNHIIIDNLESKNDGNGYGSPVWSYHDGSVTQSPPMQTMSPSGYDPNRIPSSIFSSPKPMEWSVQSNESLFSIHIGNASFSRDHVFALNKSGELFSVNDSIGTPTPMTLPTVEEVAHDNKEMERHSVSSDSSDETASLAVENDYERIELPVEVHTPVVDQTPKDHCKEVNQAMVPSDEAKNYNSVSYRSVESDRSFQFPILTLDNGRNSYSTIESEKQERNEHKHQHQHQHQQPEKPVELVKPETENAPPKKSGRSWCFCLSCSPCCF